MRRGMRWWKRKCNRKRWRKRKIMKSMRHLLPHALGLKRAVERNSHLKLLWRTMDLNINLRKILNGGNFDTNITDFG
jgi:hypothetical protein